MEEQVRSESNLGKAVRLSGRGQNKITHSGGDNEGVTPVPIPNTEVKPFSADGTWLETARESRSLPDSISLRCKSSGAYFIDRQPQPQSTRLSAGQIACFG